MSRRPEPRAFPLPRFSLARFSLARLGAVVALLVVSTGVAVGFYVDALASDPVRAAETRAEPYPLALTLSPLTRAHVFEPVGDDVRTGRHELAPSRRPCRSAYSACPSDRRRSAGSEDRAAVSRILGLGEPDRPADERGVSCAGAAEFTGA